jgi:predicted phage terminase large subunit-like protein
MSTRPVTSAIAEQNPLAHPAIASMQLFEYSLPPGRHLETLYNALWKATADEYLHAPKKIARLLPRGHGKSEAMAVVFPAWTILTRPDARVAVISKTRDPAGERTEKIVEAVERFGPHFGVEIASSTRQHLTTAANDHKETTLAPYGLESQLTGKHFDVIVWDDIVDWENQRTETQRRNVRQYFRDYTKNLVDPDSVLDGGGVQAMIGTRKHPQDLYATDILDSPTWDTEVRTAIAERDWPLVESRAWSVRGDDGETYPDIGALPADVQLANNGIIPDRPIDVLWPEHKPAESLLYDIADGNDSLAIWRRENQQDPDALAGEVFRSEWLTYIDDLPNPRSAYRWCVGMDIGLVDDLQQAAEGDTDYTAIAVIAWDRPNDRGYLTHLARDRGLSVKAAADWATTELAGIDVDAMLIEQNANRGVAQRLRDDSPIPAAGTTSTGSKEERIHNMAAEFEASDLRIIGDPDDETWRSFEVDEWLQFPNAAHDDRLDAIEIALRSCRSGITEEHADRRTPTIRQNRQSSDSERSASRSRSRSADRNSSARGTRR